MAYKKLFTSESVGKGHPDKICDQISDATLDYILAKDPAARTAIEVLATNGLIVIAGEVKTKVEMTPSQYIQIAKQVLQAVGYLGDEFRFEVCVSQQSPDISQGVDQSNGKLGAGDQGLIFGYAINETKELMPLAIVLAHELAKRAEQLRANGEFPYAKADLKTQVTIDYHNSHPQIDTILMSIQHEADFDETEFRAFVKHEIMDVVAKRYHLNTDFKVLINPTGRFVIGGPIGDTGLTGRKIIVDTYGGKGHHGGGAFSGKDYTKVDRSAAYAARYAAKNLVASGLASEVEIQIAYAIGKEEPVSIAVETFGTGTLPNATLELIVQQLFDFTPRGIIRTLDLTRPIYLPTATFGHFGRLDLDLPWERLDKVEAILALAKTLKA